VKLFAQGDAPPQFVEEVYEEHHLVFLFGASPDPAGVTTSTRLPSGARFHILPPSLAIHPRGLSGTNVPPFAL
jgi:hypothetical protein